ncbi:hypothetical protein QTQ03_09135 [Micromonospora sp. WMMA1363]|uniref:hypothetical protein n=1 Tax=Micromonospora sp. WMMA1363 TaxID=3053985 RepID=UPI00259CDD1F|nr:hypothetical protein [Micromonospora sp. WMMA1363]MDM4719731.1 hypothetical protein [Micromonospora sp. WMMA1363]
MAEQNPVVVLVDAYTSAEYLPPEFAALGVELVHVHSTSEFMPSMPAPDLSAYRAAIVHRDLATTAELLARYDPVCVIAGQEPVRCWPTPCRSASACSPTSPAGLLPAGTSTR